MPFIFETLRSISALSGVPDWALLTVAALIPCLIVFLLIQAVSGGSTYIERKVAADIQRRVGPNKCNVGAFFGEFARATVANAKSPHAGAPAKLMATLIG